MTVREIMAILDAISEAKTLIEQISHALQHKTKIDITKQLPPLIEHLNTAEQQLSEHHIQLIQPDAEEDPGQVDE